MDRTKCYSEMFLAMRNGDCVTARERALALKEWLSRGGFYPLGYTLTEVDAYLANVLRRAAGQKSGEMDP